MVCRLPALFHKVSLGSQSWSASSLQGIGDSGPLDRFELREPRLEKRIYADLERDRITIGRVLESFQILQRARFCGSAFTILARDPNRGRPFSGLTVSTLTRPKSMPWSNTYANPDLQTTMEKPCFQIWKNKCYYGSPNVNMDRAYLLPKAKPESWVLGSNNGVDWKKEDKAR